MTRVRVVGLALLSAAVLSCSPAPLKIAAGEQCFRCRRSIRETRVAAEAISGDHSRIVAKFKGPGCMAKYLVDHPAETPVVYVTDFTSGSMMRPDAAYFVAEVVDRNTGETDYRAYSDQADAQAAAVELRTTPVSWSAVLDEAR